METGLVAGVPQWRPLASRSLPDLNLRWAEEEEGGGHYELPTDLIWKEEEERRGGGSEAERVPLAAEGEVEAQHPEEGVDDRFRHQSIHSSPSSSPSRQEALVRSRCYRHHQHSSFHCRHRSRLRHHYHRSHCGCSHRRRHRSLEAQAMETRTSEVEEALDWKIGIASKDDSIRDGDDVSDGGLPHLLCATAFGAGLCLLPCLLLPAGPSQNYFDGGGLSSVLALLLHLSVASALAVKTARKVALSSSKKNSQRRSCRHQLPHIPSRHISHYLRRAAFGLVVLVPTLCLHLSTSNLAEHLNLVLIAYLASGSALSLVESSQLRWLFLLKGSRRRSSSSSPSFLLWVGRFVASSRGLPSVAFGGTLWALSLTSSPHSYSASTQETHWETEGEGASPWRLDVGQSAGDQTNRLQSRLRLPNTNEGRTDDGDPDPAGMGTTSGSRTEDAISAEGVFVSSIPGRASSSSLRLPSYSSQTQATLLGVSLIVVTSVTLVSFLALALRSEGNEEESEAAVRSERRRPSPSSLLLLVLPPVLFLGLLDGHMESHFLKVSVPSVLGPGHLGLCMLVLGVGRAVAAWTSGHVLQHCPKWALTGATSLFHLGLLTVLSNWRPRPDDPAMFCAVAFVWGAASAAWELILLVSLSATGSELEADLLVAGRHAGTFLSYSVHALVAASRSVSTYDESGAPLALLTASFAVAALCLRKIPLSVDGEEDEEGTSSKDTTTSSSA